MFDSGPADRDSGKTAQKRDDPWSADGDGPPMPHAAVPTHGAS